MKTRMVLSLGLSALVFGGAMVGFTAGGGSGVASAGTRDMAVVDKHAAAQAGKATKALAKRDAIGAIGYAEAAVSLSPRSAAYRMLLGQSYLQGGRFASAAQTFADVLALSADNGKAALDYALAQIATGDWAAAQKTLDVHAATIPTADRGLAVALAGNPAAGVALLTEAARGPGADAKTRQNLALTFALAGQWNMARVVAEADMSPADVDRRMEEWATFAQPKTASDQVAALLGVKPVLDAGQPVALALNTPVPVTAASVAVAAAAPAPAVVAPAVVAAAPIAIAAPMASPLPAIAAPMSVPTLLAKANFAPLHEVVQNLPAALIRADSSATKISLLKADRPTPAPVAAKGNWYVQIGAFHDARVAKDGWSRATHRFAALSGHIPTGTAFTAKTGSFYRLSVGGFTRGDADTMCRRYRQTGGDCFVRAAAGDQTAQWLRKGSTQLASRM